MGRADVGMLARKRVPPIEWGKKPSPRCGHFRDETELPQDEVVVVGVYCFLTIIIDDHGCCITLLFSK